MIINTNIKYTFDLSKPLKKHVKQLIFTSFYDAEQHTACYKTTVK